MRLHELLAEHQAFASTSSSPVGGRLDRGSNLEDYAFASSSKHQLAGEPLSSAISKRVRAVATYCRPKSARIFLTCSIRTGMSSVDVFHSSSMSTES